MCWSDIGKQMLILPVWHVQISTFYVERKQAISEQGDGCCGRLSARSLELLCGHLPGLLGCCSYNGGEGQFPGRENHLGRYHLGGNQKQFNYIGFKKKKKP
jgi:hypothetical protein